MSTPRVSLPIAVLLLGIALQCQAEANVMIGNIAVALPDVEQLVSSESDIALVFANGTLSSSKHLLHVWSQPNEKAQTTNDFPTAYRYALAYVMSGFENRDISAKDFEKIRQIIGSDVSAIESAQSLPVPQDIPEIVSRVKALGVDPSTASIKSEVKLLARTEDIGRLTYVLLQNAQLQVPAGPRSVWLLACMNTLLVKGRVFTLNVFAQYRDAEDIAWLSQSCSGIVSAAITANR